MQCRRWQTAAAAARSCDGCCCAAVNVVVAVTEVPARSAARRRLAQLHSYQCLLLLLLAMMLLMTLRISCSSSGRHCCLQQRAPAAVAHAAAAPGREAGWPPGLPRACCLGRCATVRCSHKCQPPPLAAVQHSGRWRNDELPVGLCAALFAGAGLLPACIFCIPRRRVSAGWAGMASCWLPHIHNARLSTTRLQMRLCAAVVWHTLACAPAGHRDSRPAVALSSVSSRLGG